MSITAESLCPLCKREASDFIVITHRKNVPVEQNFLMPTLEDALKVTKGDLKVVLCAQCSFVFNADFESEKINYNKNYENKQHLSTVFLAHLREVSDLLRDKYFVTAGQKILEVGCGQGFFLETLVKNLGLKGLGFDPSYRGDACAHEDIQYYSDYFSEKYKHLDTDIVLSRHVIEHTPDPLAFINSIKKATQIPVQLFLETPDITWILKNHVLWDFFYEHCSYFSPTTLSYAAALSGFSTQDIQTVFQDQYLWIYALSAPSATVESSSFQNENLMNLAKEYSAYETQARSQVLKNLRTLSKGGALALWGAGAKGVCFSNLFDPDQHYLRGVLDINTDTQGSFIPGTGHEIFAPEDLFKHQVRTVIVMNPNYFQECQLSLGQKGEEINWILGDDLLSGDF